MANTTKVVAIFAILAFLQVWCATGLVPAVMSVHGFEERDEGGPAECDGMYHSNALFLVALNTKWFRPSLFCHKKIGIRSSDALYVEAMVVDECEIPYGCSENEITTSPAVWKFLGLDASAGQVNVTWSYVI